jgi:hypothetical protein
MCFSNHGLRFVSAPSYLRLVIWLLNFCAIVTIVIALEAAFLLISVVLMFTVNMCCILWILEGAFHLWTEGVC